MGDALGDLVETLLVVGRDGEDIADITESDLLAQIHSHLVVVGGVESGDAPDALGAEAGAGAVGGAAVMGYADNRHIKLADAVDVLDVGGLHEGVDAGVVGQLTAREGGNAPIHDALGCLEAVAQALIHLLLPTGERQGTLLFQSRLTFGGVTTLESAGCIAHGNGGGRGGWGGLPGFYPSVPPQPVGSGAFLSDQTPPNTLRCEGPEP